MIGSAWVTGCVDEMVSLGWVTCPPASVQKNPVTAPGGFSDIERSDMELFNLLEIVIASGVLDADR